MRLLSLIRRAPKRTSAVLTMIAAAIIVPAALFAWGPNRPTYTLENPADHITFDSITNNPNIGDERNFVNAREAGSSTTWSDNTVVQPGKEYTVRLYVHNNAASSLNLVAHDVTAMVNLPTTTGKTIQVNGFIDSSNASPTEVYDSTTFSSTSNFNLAYVPGTLKYENNAVGPNGVALPESIFTSAGAKLGYDKMDGNIPGCFQYAGYVTFTVKPQFEVPATSQFTMSKLVSKHGANQWTKSYAAQPGEVVDYLIQYKNVGNVQQDAVTFRDTLPTGESYVPGSTTFTNSTTPSGVKASDNLTNGTGINVGSYSPGANAFVIFSAKVADNDGLPTCGPNTLVNNAKVTTGGGSISDTANVTVGKTCVTPPTYTCNALSATQISGGEYKFNGSASASNGATIKSYTFDFGDGHSTTVTNPTGVAHTYTMDGKTYTAKLSVTVSVNGTTKTVTSDACAVKITTPQPTYTCDALTASLVTPGKGDYKFNGKASASNGAVIKNYTFDFGDGNKTTVTNPTGVAHTYTLNGKTYTATLIANVTVNGTAKSVTSSSCVVKITVGQPPVNPECKPGIPVGDSRCTPVTPPVTPPTTPGELPHTGAGADIATFLGLGSLIASIGYYINSRRAILGR